MDWTLTRAQRHGLVMLLLLIPGLQALMLFGDFSPDLPVSSDEKAWLAMEHTADSVNHAKPAAPKIFPFNPNFITDYKGYRLGMSVAEIDRLLAFRKTGKYVNSAAEFQAVTGVSDSLLRAISGYFKFPDWVNRKRDYPDYKVWKREEKAIVMKDINAATAEDLIAIRGIGPAFSQRIMAMRERLGGFVSMEQMNDVWGLQPEVVAELQKHFNVSIQPVITRLKVNDASLKELLQFPYFHYPVGKNVLTYRSMHGRIANAEDLAKVDGITVDKVKIIAIYLEF